MRPANERSNQDIVTRLLLFEISSNFAFPWSCNWPLLHGSVMQFGFAAEISLINR
jgi:hypothetical protein